MCCVCETFHYLLINNNLLSIFTRFLPTFQTENATELKIFVAVGFMSLSFACICLLTLVMKQPKILLQQPFAPFPEQTLQSQQKNMSSLSIAQPQHAMKTLIIIPTYNEVENLPMLLKEIFLYAPTTDVLIVDDNSPDGTGELADEIQKQNRHVHVLHRPGKLGLGTAYIVGFQFAIKHGYDAAFEMDADFSHDPRYLPDFLKAVQGADLIIGSRYIPGGNTPDWSIVRRLISGSGNIFARFMLGLPVHDCTGGFRCYRREVLQSIDLDTVQSRGYAFQVELTYRAIKQGFKIVETPITFMDRRHGKSKMSRKIVMEAFTYVLRTRFTKQPSMNGTMISGITNQTITSILPKEQTFANLKTTSRLRETSHKTIRPVKLLPLE